MLVTQDSLIAAGLYEILPKTPLGPLAALICSDEFGLQIVCSAFVSFLSGWDFVQFDAVRNHLSIYYYT